MPWGYAIAAVATYPGSQNQKKGAEKSANAQERAAQQSVDEQRRQFDLSRSDQMPWLQAGTGALGQLQQLNAGNYTDFYKSPDYLATQAQGLNTLDKSAAARGGLFGGGHTRDTMRFGQDLAAQQLGAYRGSLQSLAGVGQSSAQNLGALGQNSANSISNAYTNAGNARATAYTNQANANSNMWNSFGQIAGAYFGNAGVVY